MLVEEMCLNPNSRKKNCWIQSHPKGLGHLPHPGTIYHSRWGVECPDWPSLTHVLTLDQGVMSIYLNLMV